MTAFASTISRIVLLGGGRMGAALLRGWLSRGVPASSVTVIDPFASPYLQELADSQGLVLNPQILEPADFLILAVKPQMVEDAVSKTSLPLSADGVVISIMAGKTLANLRSLFPKAAGVVRAMPNLAVSVGRGATVAVANPNCPASSLAGAGHLLAASGALIWLETETLVDAATALSGSGPAYVFYMTECMTQAGINAGLPAAIAAQLAQATVAGAGALLHETARPPAELRAEVTSPGGATQAGLEVLCAGNRLQSLLDATLLASKRRAAELAG